MEELKKDDKKTQKNRKKRSWVWQHFNDLGESTAQCMVRQCLSSISYKDGTNKMSYHLKNDHQIFEKGEDEEKPSQKLKVEFPKQRDLESAMYVREKLNINYHSYLAFSVLNS